MKRPTREAVEFERAALDTLDHKRLAERGG